MRLTTDAIRDETTKPKLKKKVIYRPQKAYEPIYDYEYHPSFGFASATKSLISKFLLFCITLLI